MMFIEFKCNREMLNHGDYDMYVFDKSSGKS